MIIFFKLHSRIFFSDQEDHWEFYHEEIDREECKREKQYYYELKADIEKHDKNILVCLIPDIRCEIEQQSRPGVQAMPFFDESSLVIVQYENISLNQQKYLKQAMKAQLPQNTIVFLPKDIDIIVVP